MTAQEIELLAREIISAVLSSQKVEDSRIELKASWPDAEKAAHRLAGHANASRDAPILWLIGVDEKSCSVSSVNAVEKANWYKSVEKYFDGFAPRLLVDVNIRVENSTVVALYFDTEHESPYVVKNKTGGSYPEHAVPWREGTRIRAARRDELLQILAPIQKVPVLELIDAKLTVENLLPHGSLWKLQMKVYVVSRSSERIYVPFHRCRASIKMPIGGQEYELPNIVITPDLYGKALPPNKNMGESNSDIWIEGAGMMRLFAQATRPDKSQVNAIEIASSASLYFAHLNLSTLVQTHLYSVVGFRQEMNMLNAWESKKS